MRITRQILYAALFVCLSFCLVLTRHAQACTGITLKATNGAVVYGRSLEWGTFDLNSRVSIMPRGLEFVGATPDGKPGLKWKGKFGVVGIDGLEKDFLCDGMNEKGLAVGLFYHPGYAQYSKYLPEQAAKSLGPTDVAQFILTQFSSVDGASGL